MEPPELSCLMNFSFFIKWKKYLNNQSRLSTTTLMNLIRWRKLPIHNQSPLKLVYLKFSDALVNLSMPPESHIGYPKRTNKKYRSVYLGNIHLPLESSKLPVSVAKKGVLE